MRTRDLSIRANLTLLILSASSLAVLFASFAFGIYERSNYRSNAVRELTALADTLGENTAASLAFNDQKTAEGMLGALATEPHVLAAFLYNTDGSLSRNIVVLVIELTSWLLRCVPMETTSTARLSPFVAECFSMGIEPAP